MKNNSICGLMWDFSQNVIQQIENPNINCWFQERSRDFFNELEGLNAFNSIQNIKWQNDTILQKANMWHLPPEKFIHSIGNEFTIIMNERNSANKKKLGQEFTPYHIVHQMIQEIFKNESYENLKNHIILDFAVGSGNFIVQLLHYYFDLIQKESKPSIFGEKKEKNKDNLIIQKILRLKTQIYAIDIDVCSIFACFLFSSLVLFHFCQEQKILISQKIVNCLPFFELSQINFFDFQDIYPNVTPSLIIGNPPYIFNRDLTNHQKLLLEKRNLQTFQGQFDVSDLFIEFSMKILKNGGKLGVIIPETILMLEKQRIIRSLIIQKSSQIKITHVANSFKNIGVENILLYVDKTENPTAESVKLYFNEKEPLNIHKKTLLEEKNIPLIPREKFEQEIINWVKKNYYSIDQWNNLHPNDKFFVFRGIELSKDGMIMQCQNCSKWMPMSRKREICIHCHQILKNPLITKSIVLDGKEVNNINLQSTRNFIQTFSQSTNLEIAPDSKIFIDYPGLNYKPLQNYSQQRIIVRQLLAKHQICASIAPPNTLTSQSIYNINIPLELSDDIHSLTKILRSPIISYYNYITFSQGKRLFSRILLQKLKDLPWIPKNWQTPETLPIPNEFIEKIESVMLYE